MTVLGRMMLVLGLWMDCLTAVDAGDCDYAGGGDDNHGAFFCQQRPPAMQHAIMHTCVYRSDSVSNSAGQWKWNSRQRTQHAAAVRRSAACGAVMILDGAVASWQP